MAMETDVDVLIVGGGWAGTSAALALHEHNLKHPKDALRFALLEGHADRLGGRAYSFEHTFEGPDGKPRKTSFEHGAQYIGQEQKAIWGVVQDAIARGLIAADDLVDGYAARYPYKEQVMMVAGRRYQYDRDQCLFGIGGVPPDLGIWDLIGSLVFIQAVEAFEQAIDVLSPWSSPAFVTELDQVTMQEWIDGFGLPPGAASLMKVSVEAVLSVQCDQVSAFYFLWYCACNGGFLNEVNDEQGGPQQFYLACGLDTLIDRLVEPIRDRIFFGEVVREVEHDPHGVTVRTAKGTHRAKKVLLAISPASAGHITFSPELPAAWQKVTSQSMGVTLKCQLFYRTPFWRNVDAQSDPALEGVPQYTGYCGANDYPVIWVMDYSPVGAAPEYADQGCYCLMTFTIGDEAKQLGPNPTKERVAEVVTAAVSNLLNDARALSTSDEFLGLEMFEWSEGTPLIPGGPNTVFGPGILTGEDAPAKVFDQPVGKNLYFGCAELARTPIGERTSKLPVFIPNWQDFGQTGVYSDWRENVGYMDGAITSGRYVAQQMLVDLGLEKGPSILARMEAWAEELLAYGEARLEDLFMKPSSSPPPTVTEAQVVAVLTTLCESLYSASAPTIAAWQERQWKNDAPALQAWVTDTLVEALVANGLLDAPPTRPAEGCGIGRSIAYMIEMAAWSPKFMDAAVAFTKAGYALYAAYEPPRHPDDPYTFSEVVELTRVVNALMALKSAEPYQPGCDVSTPGRLLSVHGVLRGGAGSTGR
ncbi:MAG: FAD-dependent oxidoreductase [Myxococcales bacterium]|nr:FAD-dependent oxidoreductase [Myxococcales bacterium]